MIVTKTGERIFLDPEEEKDWWSMIFRENQLDLDIQLKKQTLLQASDGYHQLHVVVGLLGFDEDAERLRGKISVLYDPAQSSNPTIRHLVNLSVLGKGERGTNN